MILKVDRALHCFTRDFVFICQKSLAVGSKLKLCRGESTDGPRREFRENSLS